MRQKNYLTILICLLLATLTFTACSSDDDEEGSSDSYIVVNGVGCDIMMHNVVFMEQSAMT
ncbi:MAG: hypothetical protein IJZ86_01730 [Bacteroides sp.]|nr:hypothetical protein [Bacteroides sp.]